MKKIFFASAFAILFASMSLQAITFYAEYSNYAMHCEDEAVINCSQTLSPFIRYYEEPIDLGQITEVNFSQFEDLTRIN